MEGPALFQPLPLQVQIVNPSAPAHLATTVPPALAVLPAGSILRGMVNNRDGQGHVLLKTDKGDVTIKTDIFMKRGIEVAIKLESVKDEMLARLISIDGKSVAKYLESLSGAPLEEEVILRNSVFRVEANPTQAASAKAFTTAKAAPSGDFIAIFLNPPADEAEQSSLPQPLRLLLTQAQPGQHLTVRVVGLEFPQPPVSASSPASIPAAGTSPTPALPPATSASPAALPLPLQPSAVSPAPGATPAPLQALFTPPATASAPPPGIAPQLAAQALVTSQTAAPAATPPVATLPPVTATPLPQPPPTLVQPLSSPIPATTANPLPGLPPVTLPPPTATPATLPPGVVAFESLPPVAATVIGGDARAGLILHSDLGTLRLLTPSTLPQGTKLQLEITALIPAALPVESLSEPVAASRGFRALETLAMATHALPMASGPVTAHLVPHPGKALASEILLLLTALKGGDLRKWIGNDRYRELEKNQELLTRLSAEWLVLRGNIQEAREPMQWNSFQIPFLVGEHIEAMRLFHRQHGDKKEKDEKNKDGQIEHFILDVTLSQLGKVQLDGLVRRPTGKAMAFDLAVRSERPFTEPMKQDIRAIYLEAQSLTGFEGGVTFTSGKDACYKLDAPPSASGSGGQSILA